MAGDAESCNNEGNGSRIKAKHLNAPVRQLRAEFCGRVASRDKQCEEQEEQLRGKHVDSKFPFGINRT